MDSSCFRNTSRLVRFAATFLHGRPYTRIAGVLREAPRFLQTSAPSIDPDSDGVERE